MLKRNIAANLASGLWTAGLVVVITPIQVHYLGLEAYGVVAFMMTLQLLASVFDLGLSSTITREVAADRSLDLQESRPLIRTGVLIYWAMALFCASVLAGAGRTLAEQWFTPQALGSQQLVHALQIAAVFIGLRWPIALYSGFLAGIQRMDILNLVKVSAVTLRLVGGVAVLMASGGLSTFLTWFAISAGFEVVAFAAVCRWLAPNLDWRPGFSARALQVVWRFSLTMNGLAIIAVLITQLDRLLISVALPLESLGNYSVAYTAATAVSMVLASLSTALMPSYAHTYATGAREALLAKYVDATRATVFATGLISLPLVFFGGALLTVWVGTDIANAVAPTMALLSIGMWLSAAVSNSYNVAVAERQTGALLAISAGSLVLYWPMLYLLIANFGVAGAGAAWAILNAGYLVTLVPYVNRRILRTSIVSWYIRTVVPFGVLGVLTFGSLALAVAESDIVIVHLGATVAASAIYLTCGYFLLGNTLRAEAKSIARRLFASGRVS